MPETDDDVRLTVLKIIKEAEAFGKDYHGFVKRGYIRGKLPPQFPLDVDELTDILEELAEAGDLTRCPTNVARPPTMRKYKITSEKQEE